MTVFDELQDREPLFHRGQDPDALMDADFWEVGASGTVYSRAYVPDALRARHADDAPDPWETDEFACRAVGHDTFLLTYLLHQGERASRRATLWRRTATGWKALYHQGTLVGR